MMRINRIKRLANAVTYATYLAEYFMRHGASSFTNDVEYDFGKSTAALRRYFYKHGLIDAGGQPLLKSVSVLLDELRQYQESMQCNKLGDI